MFHEHGHNTGPACKVRVPSRSRGSGGGTRIAVDGLGPIAQLAGRGFLCEGEHAREMLKREEVAWVFLDVCIEVPGAFELGGKGGNDTRVAAEACCNSVDDNTEAVWRAHGLEPEELGCQVWPGHEPTPGVLRDTAGKVEVLAGRASAGAQGGRRRPEGEWRAAVHRGEWPEWGAFCDIWWVFHAAIRREWDAEPFAEYAVVAVPELAVPPAPS